MERELHHELRPRGLDWYRGEAKRLLRALRAGDAAAQARAGEALGDRWRERFVLADALHVVAREHGHRSWPAFKHEVESQAGVPVRRVGRIGAAPAPYYERAAAELLRRARAGEPDALARLRARVPRVSDGGAATEDDARLCLAHEYGFPTWAELAEAADRANRTHYSVLPPDTPWKRAEAAIRAGDAAALAALLDEHPGLELEDPGMTLLCAATQPEAGGVPREVVDLLVAAGSELDVALNLAACFDKADMVGWLLDAGADPEAVEIWGITPLQTAAYHGARSAVDVLARRTGLHPDALYIAAAAGDLARLDAFFDGGELRADAFRERPNLCDVGWPPRPPAGESAADVLAEALAVAAHVGRVESCAALLARGADPAGRLHGLTPLHFAASLGRLEAARLLVEHGAPLDATDDIHGGTPLDWARHERPDDAALLTLLEGVRPL